MNGGRARARRRANDERAPTQSGFSEKPRAFAPTPTYASPRSWSIDQERALDKTWRWLSDPNGQHVFKLHGFAGSGKTTCAVEIGSAVKTNVRFCALAGKAAVRLVERGAPRDRTSTIHRLIYKCAYDEKHDRFVVKRRPKSELADIDLIVVDEASMVSARIAQDLISFNRPVLAVADPFQLPPPDDDASAPFADGGCDVLLSKVHRQVADSPILRLAHAIRCGEPWRRFVDGYAVQATDVLRVEDAAALDALIVGRNSTRRLTNKLMRRHLGYVGQMPNEGEVVVCLKNDYDCQVFNGETFEIVRVMPVPKIPAVDLELSNLQYPANASVRVPISFFEDGLPPERRTVPRPWQSFDYGYCLTCHKSQGSEWESVAVTDESRCFREMSRRWLYTAVTRASKTVTLITGGGVR